MSFQINLIWIQIMVRWWREYLPWSDEYADPAINIKFFGWLWSTSKGLRKVSA